jgi:hypothetical protein
VVMLSKLGYRNHKFCETLITNVSL